MLTRGGSLARGRVVKRKRDQEGNPTGRAHENPILDTRQYEVEFDDGSIDEYTTNIIAESMIAQCDPDGNEYLWFDTFVNYRSTDDDMSLEE